jgi:hypothetical protein
MSSPERRARRPSSFSQRFAGRIETVSREGEPSDAAAVPHANAPRSREAGPSYTPYTLADYERIKNQPHLQKRGGLGVDLEDPALVAKRDRVAKAKAYAAEQRRLNLEQRQRAAQSGHADDEDSGSYSYSESDDVAAPQRPPEVAAAAEKRRRMLEYAQTRIPRPCVRSKADPVATAPAGPADAPDELDALLARHEEETRNVDALLHSLGI